MSVPSRIWLSPPHVGSRERELLLDAFDSNWIAPLGPHVDAFEQELAAVAGVSDAAALSSGTAGLHLALVLLGVGRDDEVLLPTLTFAASANAVSYVGARPVFVDVRSDSWNVDPDLVAEELEACARRGKLPKAFLGVDLYGQCADWDALRTVCERWGVPLIEDAAEALGATYRGRPAGGLADFGVLSFNGNKLITTSGGGALLSNRGDLIERARFLATQAKEPAAHYEHREIGFNYRLSNLLAAIGRAQLESLHDRVERRRTHNAAYRAALGRLPGVHFQPEAPECRSTFWLTCLTIDPREFGADREAVRLALDSVNIESRPVWKPMHLQPVFAGCRVRGGAIAESLFTDGLCLPSGSAMSDDDRDRVIEAVIAACPNAPFGEGAFGDGALDGRNHDDEARRA